MSTEEPKTEGPRSFTRALEMIAQGDLVHDASEQLHRLLRDVRDEAQARGRAAKGSMTLKLTLSVEPHGIVEITPSISTKTADRKLARGLLYLTPGANLTPENQRQTSLPLREVSMVDEPVDVAAEAANAPKEV